MTQPTIIDVRTPAEYAGGHIEGSYNFPLQELAHHLDEIRVLPQPVIICCASGIRSGQAAMFLNSEGIRCENGGGWAGLINQINNHVSIS